MLVLKNEFKLESLMQATLTPTAFEIVEMTQLMFWLKVYTLITLNEEIKIMEVYTKFCISFFKPFKLTGVDEKTDGFFKSIWRINFVNENYKSIDAYCRTNNDKSQQWMVNLLSLLQECYFEVAKSYCRFRIKDVTKNNQNTPHFELLQSMITSEEGFYTKELDPKSFSIDIRELYNKQESFVVSSLANCTNNLLNHVYFKTHPRAFLTKYINSLDIHLSLLSKYSLEAASTWIDKASDRIHYSHPFRSVFKILAASKAMFYLRQGNTIAAILSLLEVLSSRFSVAEAADDYNTAASMIRQLSARLTEPVKQSLEKLVAIDNGMITIDE